MNIGYIPPTKPIQSMQYMNRATLKAKTGIQSVTAVRKTAKSEKLHREKYKDTDTFRDVLEERTAKGKIIHKKV
jgi:hypothetical protein